MCRHGESDIDRTAIAYDCFPAWYVDFHLMVVKKTAVQRKNCLVNSLLGDKEQAPTVRITINHCSLTWCCDEVQQFGGQSCSGLDINPDARQLLRATNCGDGDPGIMSKRAQNALWPDRWTCWRFGKRRHFAT